MAQQKFLNGGEYGVGDPVILAEKQWRITDIRQGIATLTRYDGTGQRSEQKIKLTSLPQKELSVVSPPKKTKAPDFKAGQELKNGWKIVRPSVVGKFFVNTGDGIQKELRAEVIAAAIDQHDEDVLHQRAEAFAKAELAQQQASQKADSETSEPSPDKSDHVVGLMAQLAEIVKRMSEIDQQIEQISNVEKRITEKITEALETKVSAIDEQIAALESRLSVAQPPPQPTLPRENRPVEVKTVVQHSVSPMSDNDLAELLNDGWRILHVTDYEGGRAVIRLVRERNDARVLGDGEHQNRVILRIPENPPMQGDKMVVEDVSARYVGMRGAALAMARQWDDEIKQNTRRLMGDHWYDRYGA